MRAEGTKLGWRRCKRKLPESAISARELAWRALWLLAVLALGAQADDKDAPSLEFLEYLGTLVEADGEWVGPEDLDEDVLFRRVANTSDKAPGSHEQEVIE